MCNALRLIMAELPEDLVRRMRNWARAKAGCSGAYAQVSFEPVATGGYREAPMPILGGEADDTDRALQTLDARHRQAVELFWC